MAETETERAAGTREARLRATLEQLLAIQATTLKAALDEASDLLVAAVGAEKVDVFIEEKEKQTLVAFGTSNTPLGRKQKSVGLDRLPIANGGRIVEIFLTGKPHIHGAVDQDEGEIVGIRQTLGIRSQIGVAIDLHGSRRGVLSACSTKPDAFTEDDLRFFMAVSHWTGMVARRAELVERTTSEAMDEARRVAAEHLITVLAHDLGNYLTPLVGRVALLRDRARREGRVADLHDAESMVRSMGRLRKMITSLLDVSRLDHGILELTRQPVNLSMLARETAQALQTQHTAIRVEAPDELVAEVDPDRLRQVLENLLTNAIKHGPQGSPILVRVVGKESSATIAVMDEGPGIPPDIQSRIFERFVAGQRSKGLGLGLYLARSITEAHGGSITVESAAGAGTTFCVSVPLHPPDEDPDL